jgi:hypothetical protein
MKIEMTVEYNDATTKDVDAVFADFVAFERTWNRSVTKFEQELRLTDLAWLAWHSEKRNKQTQMPFDPDWIGLVTAISVRENEDAEGADPLALTQQPT